MKIQRELLIETSLVTTRSDGERTVVMQACKRSQNGGPAEVTMHLSTDQAKHFPVGSVVTLTIESESPDVQAMEDPDSGGQGKRKR